MTTELRAHVDEHAAAASSRRARLIYDVGLHDGNDTAYYLGLGFHVVAIEANPALAHAAARRFARQTASGRLQIVNVGIAATSGVARFWVCDDHSDWSSFDRAFASRNGSAHHAIEIPTTSFASLLQQYGVPYYCKIDIEGNDRLCLESMRGGLCPPYLSVELPRSPDDDPLPRLRALGYRRFKVVDQTRFCSLEPRIHELLRAPRPFGSGVRACNRLLRSRRSHEGWTFQQGTSGPIGPATPGRWLDLEAIRRVCVFAKAYMQRVGLPEWFDLHAAL